MKAKRTLSETIGTPIILEFLDHCSTDGTDLSPLKCVSIGFLISEDETSYYLATWSSEAGVNDQNTDVFVILKSTVLSVTDLRLGKRRKK